jgi:hypothetical protein
MNKTKVWIIIVSTALTAGLSTGAGFFPEHKYLLSSLIALVTAIGTYVNGANNTK